MISLLLVWVLSAAGLFFTSRLVKGFEVKSFGSAMFASLVVGFFEYDFETTTSTSDFACKYNYSRSLYLRGKRHRP